MKFLGKLSDTYKTMELQKPQWVLEYDTSALGQVASNVAGQVGPTVLGTATNIAGKSVIDSLKNAINVLGATPAAQKMKTTLTQTTADAEKQLADATNKVVNKIKQTMDSLNKSIAAPTTAQPSATTASTTPSVPATTIQ